MNKDRKHWRPSWLLLVAALLVAGPVHGDDSQAGVVVEEVAEGSAAAKAGMQPGDVIISWARAPAPPANPQAAQGPIASPFDFRDVEVEQAPRGPLVLVGRRGQASMTWAFPPVPFGLQVRPVLPDSLLQLYQEAKELVAAKRPGEGADRRRRAAKEAEEQGNPSLSVWLLSRVADALTGPRAGAELDEVFTEAIQRVDAETQPTVAAQLLRRWADVFRTRSDWSRAADCDRRALALDERAGSESLRIAQDLNGLGLTEYRRPDLAAAERYFRQALAIQEKWAPGSLSVAGTLNSLGVLTQARDDAAGAEAYWRPALALRERWAPGSREVATSLNNLAIVAAGRWDLAAAEDYLRRSFAIAEKLAPGGVLVAANLNNLAGVISYRGDLAGGEEYYRRALAIHEKVNPGSLGVALASSGVARIIKERGDLATAEVYLQRALAIQEKLAPASLHLSNTLTDLGDLFARRGDLTLAEEYTRRAYGIREALAAEGSGVADSLRVLGSLAERRNDLVAAAEYHRRAQAMNEKLAPGSLLGAGSLNALGIVAAKGGDLAAAEAYHQQALETRQKAAPGSAQEAESLHDLGLVYRRTGRVEAASGLLLRALDALESQNTKLGGTEDVRSGFAAGFGAYYHDAIITLIDLGRHSQALHVLERSRARSLLGLLAERDLLFTADLPRELAREKRLLDGDYDSVQAQIAKLSPANDAAEVQKLLARLRELRQKQEDMVARIRKASPRFASLKYPEPLDLAGVRSALDPGTAFLAYSVGTDQAVLFVVQPAGVPGAGLSVFALPVGEKVLRAKIDAFRSAIQRPLPSGRAALLAQARELYDLLVRPAQPQLAASRRLLVSPDGPLHSLPFAALVRQEPVKTGVQAEYLVEWKPLHVVASATVYAELRRSTREEPTPPGRLVAFGDPQYPTLSKDQADRIEDPDVRSVTRSFPLGPLPFTRNEVEDITGLFRDRSQKYLGPEATEERAKSLGKEARYVHFACHGFLDERFPLNSALALTIPETTAEVRDNGLLQAWEIFDQVRLDADLVTLSACNTGLGKEMGGEGLLGLTRAFHYAGARSVLATLWAVSDRSTPLLMKRFYGYLRAGRTRDEALRAAQMDLIRKESSAKGSVDLSHPIRWAAFQLSGDWR
jgi:CHAT domain-containing protein/Tfp pilus assembly protein PilF